MLIRAGLSTTDALCWASCEEQMS